MLSAASGIRSQGIPFADRRTPKPEDFHHDVLAAFETLIEAKDAFWAEVDRQENESGHRDLDALHPLHVAFNDAWKACLEAAKSAGQEAWIEEARLALLHDRENAVVDALKVAISQAASVVCDESGSEPDCDPEFRHDVRALFVPGGQGRHAFHPDFVRAMADVFEAEEGVWDEWENQLRLDTGRQVDELPDRRNELRLACERCVAAASEVGQRAWAESACELVCASVEHRAMGTTRDPIVEPLVIELRNAVWAAEAQAR